MKFASVALTVATIALASFDHVSAVSTCSEADAETILLLTNQIFSDVNCLAAMNDECPDAACFATLEKVTKQMPNCVAGSMNPRTTFEQLLKDCKAASSTSSTSSTTTTTTPTITTTKTPSATTTTTTTKTPSATTANSIDSSIATTAAPSAATTAPSGIIISPNAGTNTGTSAATAGRSSSFSLSAGVVLSFAVVVTAFL